MPANINTTAGKAQADAQAYQDRLAFLDTLPRFYVTYQLNSNLKKHYSEIRAPNIEEARKFVHGVTKGKHAFIYAEKDWIIGPLGQPTQARAYELTPVPLQPQKRAGQYFGRTM